MWVHADQVLIQGHASKDDNLVAEGVQWLDRALRCRDKKDLKKLNDKELKSVEDHLAKLRQRYPDLVAAALAPAATKKFDTSIKEEARQNEKRGTSQRET